MRLFTPVICGDVRSIVRLAGILPLVVGGCSPLVYYVPSGAAPPQPAHSATQVQVFTDTVPPDCRYQELGFIEGQSRSRSSARTIEAMRGEAARHGADAIVLRVHQTGHHGAGHVYTAVAVRLPGGPCMSMK